MRIKEPNWDYLDGRAWEDYVRNMPHSINKEKYMQQILDTKNANIELESQGIISTKIDVGMNTFRIRPARSFYEENLVCFGYGEWTKSQNSFETTEKAMDAIYTLSLPDIDRIDPGWQQFRPNRIVKECNLKWHEAVKNEVRESTLFTEFVKIEGELSDT